MKKIIAILTAAVMLTALPVYAQFDDVDSQSLYSGAIERLTGYGILSGDGNGSFMPDAQVTRAQMAKIATIITGCDVSDSDGGLFLDTFEGYWGNKYINAAAKSNLIYGYPSGEFMPERGISYAEGITIILRTLGYGTNELGNNYPNAYIEKAGELNLTKGLKFNADEPVSREVLAYIADNALMCDMNSTGSKKSKLITKLDCLVSDECILISTNAEDSSLLSDEVQTSIGKYKTLSDDIKKYVTGTVKLVTDSDNKIVSVIPVQREHKQVAAKSIAGNEIIAADGSTVTIGYDSAVYYKGGKTTFEAVKSSLTSGTVFDIYYNNSKYDYAVITSYQLEGPTVVLSEADKQNYGTNVRVVRDGKESSLSALETYDVLYFDKALNTVYAYCDTVLGVYEEAYPNKADVSSAKISGTVYGLETQMAVNAFSDNSDSVKFNEYVNCLLGRNGEIVYIIRNASKSMNADYGVLLSSSSRVDEGTKKYYTTFLTANALVQEFETTKTYENYRGRIVKYDFSDGMLKPQFITAKTDLLGTVDAEQNKIGTLSLAKDAKLIDLLYVPTGSETAAAEAKAIDITELDGVNINKSNMVYYALDSNGKIAFAIFNDITMDGYQYALVTKVTKLSASSTYELDVNGEQVTYNVNYTASPEKYQPVMINVRDNRMLTIKALNQIKTGGKLNGLNKQTIKLGDAEYRLHKNAVFYVQDRENNYNITSVDDINIEKVGTISLFEDKALSIGGYVRVVKITLK